MFVTQTQKLIDKIDLLLKEIFNYFLLPCGKEKNHRNFCRIKGTLQCS